jgi:hypothetical protein
MNIPVTREILILAIGTIVFELLIGATAIMLLSGVGRTALAQSGFGETVFPTTDILGHRIAMSPDTDRVRLIIRSGADWSGRR